MISATLIFRQQENDVMKRGTAIFMTGTQTETLLDESIRELCHVSGMWSTL
jgi:hypothetical protein